MARQVGSSMPFDAGGWLRSPELRALPLDVRALLMDLLCLMWESPERGVMVSLEGSPYTKSEVVRIVGRDARHSGRWLDQVIAAGIIGVRCDGAIFNAKMVHDEELYRKRSAAGRIGGMNSRGRAYQPEEPDVEVEEGSKTAQEVPEPPAPVEAPMPEPAPQEEPQAADPVLFDLPTPTPQAQKPKAANKGAPPPKIAYAEFVHMTQKEHDTLVARFGEEGTQWMIAKLDNTKGSNTNKYKYTSDYRAILNWVVGAWNEERSKYVKTTYHGGGPAGQAEPPTGFARGSTLSDQ